MAKERKSETKEFCCLVVWKMEGSKVLCSGLLKEWCSLNDTIASITRGAHLQRNPLVIVWWFLWYDICPASSRIRGKTVNSTLLLSDECVSWLPVFRTGKSSSLQTVKVAVATGLSKVFRLRSLNCSYGLMWFKMKQGSTQRNLDF